MNLKLLVEIVSLAAQLMKSHAEKDSPLAKDVTVAESLLRIVNAGAEAYHEHMGEPLDPALVKPQSLV